MATTDYWNVTLAGNITSLNETFSKNVTFGALNDTLTKHGQGTHVLTPAKAYLIKSVYVLGIIGNLAAIIILRSGERRIRNRKHLLLMTSLAANDLVALVGMLTAMLLTEHLPELGSVRGMCVARVLLRIFGIGSVCIAVTMALERCVALTKPFLYQKQVTYYVIRTALLISWGWAAALTCAPIIGVGVYYDEATHTCARYRNAERPLDLAYASVYVAFGTLLCLILVYCNMAVIRALYAISAPCPRGPPVVRRLSKSSCRLRQQRSITAGAPPQHNAATAEEVAFSRLMATLSVLFMVCWLPQMITSILYLALGKSAWPRLTTLASVSDILMLLNYVLDPFLYVLSRSSRLSPRSVCAALADCLRGHKKSTESMKTSCCPQETLLVSDSSGAEMKPLRILPANNGSLVKLED